MKKNLLLIVLIFICKDLVAQQNNGIQGEKNWTNLWTNFKPKTTEYSEANEILSGNITESKTLYKKSTYLLSGSVYVTNNATLTIEPGTVIRGEMETNGTLVVTKNSKIIANASETDPIIFTSNKGINDRNAGDWGGLVILGDAPINKHGGVASVEFNLNPLFSSYGGENILSNSGILNYVRIEFAGRKNDLGRELNGLSLAGVGSKTKLNYIQVSYSKDDSFECYGGVVNLNNLVSYRSNDDDFDFTQGVQCNIYNSMALRNPYISDASISRCFEIDSYDKPENADFSKKQTSILADNITLVNTEENFEGLTREAIFIKENSNFELKNSLIHGFAPGIVLENKISLNPEKMRKIILKNVLFNACTKQIKFESTDKSDQLDSFILENVNEITISNLPQLDLFNECNLKKAVDFRVKANKSLGSR